MRTAPTSARLLRRAAAFVLPDPAGHALARHKLAVAVSVLLVAGCAGPAPTSTDTSQQGCDLSPGTQELAAEFRRLRAVQGHFQGGEWNAEVDGWMDRKHQVMIDLGSRLGDGGCGRTQITDLLGPPDVIAGPGDVVFDLVSRQPEFQVPLPADYELLIYYWRGAHDYLYFTAEGQTISSSGWWHAYE